LVVGVVEVLEPIALRVLEEAVGELTDTVGDEEDEFGWELVVGGDVVCVGPVIRWIMKVHVSIFE
jgi:hypothetical protein